MKSLHVATISISSTSYFGIFYVRYDAERSLFFKMMLKDLCFENYENGKKSLGYVWLKSVCFKMLNQNHSIYLSSTRSLPNKFSAPLRKVRAKQKLKAQRPSSAPAPSLLHPP